MTTYVITDTEGSGVFDYTKPADALGQPRMAALAMIMVTEELEIEEEHSFLIKPDGWTFDDASDAAKVNGLTHARLEAEGVPAKDALRIYGAAIDTRRIVAGFNVLHDLKQLRAELRFAGHPDRFMQTRYLCAMQGSRRLVDARTETGRKKAPRLSEACAFFGIEQKAEHTAIDDAHSVLAILRKLRELGEMPAYTDPYDRGPKKQPAKPRSKPLPDGWARGQGKDYEEQVTHEQQDFIGGAAEDGK